MELGLLLGPANLWLGAGESELGAGESELAYDASSAKTRPQSSQAPLDHHQASGEGAGSFGRKQKVRDAVKRYLSQTHGSPRIDRPKITRSTVFGLRLSPR